MTANRLFAIFGFIIAIIGLALMPSFTTIGICIAFSGALIIFSCWKGAGDVMSNIGEHLAKRTGNAVKAGKDIDYSPVVEKINTLLKEMTVTGFARGCFLITFLLAGLGFTFSSATGTQILWVSSILAISLVLWIPEKMGNAFIWVIETMFGLIGKGIMKGGAVTPLTFFSLFLATGCAAQILSEVLTAPKLQAFAGMCFFLTMGAAVWLAIAFGKVQTTKK
jgi:hypothetical protein